MLKFKWLQNLEIYLLYLLAFTIPLPFIFSAVAMVALAIVHIISPSSRKTFSNLGKRKFLWLWLAFFAFHVYSYTYSFNKSESLFDIQVKLPFIIFPIVIGAGIYIDRIRLQHTLLAFVLGVSSTAAFCIGRALYFWKQNHHTNSFFYHTLVDKFDANAVYISWYCLFSISILFFIQWKYRILNVMLLLLNITFFILLASKTLIAVFLIVLIPAYILKNITSEKFSWVKTLSTALVGILLATSLVITENPVKRRYKEILNKNIDYALTRNYDKLKQSELNNLTLRIFLWRIGLENTEDCDLWLKGAGNGDVKDVQYMKMVEYDLYGILSDRYYEIPAFAKANLHNMYMQSLLMLGIPGLTLFVLIVCIPFFLLRRLPYSYIFLMFFLGSAIFMMQEAALQTQAGTIYYCLFSCLFFNIYYTAKNEHG